MVSLCPESDKMIEIEIMIAGGYDAIWLLVLDPVDADPQPPVHRVEHVWANYPGVSPLSASESLAKGCRIEKLDEVKGLQKAVSRS